MWLFLRLYIIYHILYIIYYILYIIYYILYIIIPNLFAVNLVQAHARLFLLCDNSWKITDTSALWLKHWNKFLFQFTKKIFFHFFSSKRSVNLDWQETTTPLQALPNKAQTSTASTEILRTRTISITHTFLITSSDSCLIHMFIINKYLYASQKF